jgi:2-methylcitrate synthase
VAEREVIIGFGHPVYTISDPRSDIVKEVARGLAVERRTCGFSKWRSALRA